MTTLREAAQEIMDFCNEMLSGGNCPLCSPCEVGTGVPYADNPTGGGLKHDDGCLCDQLQKSLVGTDDECRECGCIASDHNGVIYKVSNGWCYAAEGVTHGPFSSATLAAIDMEVEAKPGGLIDLNPLEMAKTIAVAVSENKTLGMMANAVDGYARLRIKEALESVVHLTTEQTQALVRWSQETEKPNGCSGWGSKFDGAMSVAHAVRKQTSDEGPKDQASEYVEFRRSMDALGVKYDVRSDTDGIFTVSVTQAHFKFRDGVLLGVMPDESGPFEPVKKGRTDTYESTPKR